MKRLIIPLVLVVGFALAGCGTGNRAIDVVPPTTSLTTVAPSTTTSTSPHLKFCGASAPSDHGLTPCSTTITSSR